MSSSVSVKSDQSKGGVPNFSEKSSATKRYFMCFAVYHCISQFLSCGVLYMIELEQI